MVTDKFAFFQVHASLSQLLVPLVAGLIDCMLSATAYYCYKIQKPCIKLLQQYYLNVLTTHLTT